MTGTEPESLRIDTSKAHPARVYDFLLGGKDNYMVDEEMAGQVLAANPTVKNQVRINRRFMRIATERLARDGVRQFLDIGTGIPTEPNLHQVAQGVSPDARVVYADNDPIVLRHAEALLRSAPEGATNYIHADVREPEKVIEGALATLDLDRPVALSLVAILHFVSDEADPYGLVQRLMRPLCKGSYLVLSHISADFIPDEINGVATLYNEGGMTLRPRTRPEISRLFEGLELLEPGMVSLTDWDPAFVEDVEQSGDELPVPGYAGIARKN
jgi:S-adenosyl methyltransferase